MLKEILTPQKSGVCIPGNAAMANKIKDIKLSIASLDARTDIIGQVGLATAIAGEPPRAPQIVATLAPAKSGFSAVAKTQALNSGINSATVVGDGGNNRLSSGSANDTLSGLGGNDTLVGGAGTDTMFGGAGDDIYYVDNTGDVVSEHTVSGIDDGGSDIVRATVSYTLDSDIERLMLAGVGNLSGTGNVQDNRLDGNTGANHLYGLAGNDTLTGGAGADTMFGGTGNDIYYVDDSGDVVSEQTVSGTDDGGNDIVRSTASYTIGAGIERLILTGSDDLSGTGNAQDNRIDGNAGANHLYGKDGDDVLSGGAGLDTMYGGAGDDTYYVDNTSDVASEQTVGIVDDGGADRVQSTVSYALGAYIERLILTGSADLNGTGSAQDNRLDGNTGANHLYGMAGSDVLSGGVGLDTMYGGAGDDTYYVDNTGDVASEHTVTGVDDGGSDRVQASVSYTLSDDIEKLVQTGSAAINGTGNAQANTLYGNTGSNSLSGMDGNDTLSGFAGNDTLTGGAGADKLIVNLSDSDAATGTDRIVDLDFTSGDTLGLIGFHGTNTGITNYNQLARFLDGATVTQGSTPGSAQFTLTGANGHQQTINISDVSGNGTALQQLEAAVGSLAELGTGLLPGKTLTYVARFTDSKGNVIQSEGHNGWLSLSTFGVESHGYVSLAFGEDRAGLALFDAMTHGARVDLEVEAYQTLGGVLQLVDQYLFTGSEIITDSTYPSVSSYNLSVSQFEHDHWARDGKGALNGPTEFGWNFDTSAPVNLTDHASFLTDGSVAGGQSATLSYVVRFFDSKGQLVATEGSNGWAHIDNFGLNVLNDRAFSFSFNDGKLSVALTSALETDAGLRAEVEAYKTTANGIVTVDDLLFDHVHVANRAFSGMQGGFASLSFGTIQETHTTLDGDNKVVATGQSGWNFETKATATLSDPGDFTDSDTTVVAPADHLLVARFVDTSGNVINSEGTDGWIRLEEFSLGANPDNFPAPESPLTVAPLLVSLQLTGSDSLSLGLETRLVNDSSLSFQVESLVLVNGQYQLIDEYLFDSARVVLSSATIVAGVANAFTHTHTTYDVKGTVTSTDLTGWDLNAREAVILTDPADFDPLTEEAPSHDDTLTYVVRFLDSKGSTVLASDAGSSGWISGGSDFLLSSNSGPATMMVRMADDAVLGGLSQSMMQGGNLRMDIEAYRSTSSGLQLVDDYLFTNVTPISVEYVGDGTSAVQLRIGQYTHEHTTYDANGDATGTGSTGWNFNTDSKASVSDAGDYASGGTPSVAVEAPVALTYYARILDAKGTPYGSDGASGWIALSAFDNDQDHFTATPNGSFGIKFGDDLANLALLQAVTTGDTTLKIEVDGFDGTHLVDQMLFEHVSVDRFNVDSNQTTTTFNYDRFQVSHDTETKAGVSTFGWDLGTNSATSLTSAGAFDTSVTAGGTAHNTTYYVRLVDENGQTIATDNNQSFNQIAALSFNLATDDPYPSVAISFGSDQAFLAAFEALMEQNPLARIEIEGYINSPNGPRIIDEYLFDGVHLNSQYEAGPSVTGALAFTFEQIQLAHYLGEGKAFHAETYGWDYVDEVPATLTPPHPDIFS